MTDVWAKANITHLSASQLLRSPAKWIFDYVHLSPEERRNQGVGWRAVLGTCSHDAMQAIVCAGQDVRTSIRTAVNNYDMSEGDDDDVLRDRLREAIPGTIEQGTRVLIDAGFGGSKPEEYITLHLPGIDVPIVGYIDMLQNTSGGGIRNAEIKTKGPRKTRLLKDGSQGWSKASLPKAPEWTHVCQSAIYNAATGGECLLAYAAEHDAVIFDQTTCDELKPSGLAEALEEMRQRALIRQNLLNISTDAKTLASITDPDWRHMYQWKIKDEFIAKARALWQQ